MKIERLLGIIIVLLRNKKVTATYLAHKFSVSKRTIYRDVTDICLAGIPVITQIGNEGGIMIDDDYKIDKTLFTENELQAIFTGLLGLDSVSDDQKYQSIIEKFSNKSDRYVKNNVIIDLSSHYKNTLAPKIKDIQLAIEGLNLIEFDYFNYNGENKIMIEPYFVIFQWSNWYVFGFGMECNEFRLYKLNRLWNIKKKSGVFQLRDVPQDKLDFNQCFTNEINAIIIFEESSKYRLIEEYGIDCFSTLENGKLYFSFAFTNKEYLLEWILTFQDKAELIEPQELRVELKDRLSNAIKKYL